MPRALHHDGLVGTEKAAERNEDCWDHRCHNGTFCGRVDAIFCREPRGSVLRGLFACLS